MDPIKIQIGDRIIFDLPKDERYKSFGATIAAIYVDEVGTVTMLTHNGQLALNLQQVHPPDNG